MIAHRWYLFVLFSFSCICLDPISLPLEIQCKHSFCFLCLKGVYDSAIDAGEDSGSCPLCRGPIDDSVFDQAKLSTVEWESRNAKERDSWQWKYSGRTSGWWLFEDRANVQLEEGYQKFLQAQRDEVIKASAAAAAALAAVPPGTDPAAAVSPVGSDDDEDEDGDEDDDDDGHPKKKRKVDEAEHEEDDDDDDDGEDEDEDDEDEDADDDAVPASAPAGKAAPPMPSPSFSPSPAAAAPGLFGGFSFGFGGLGFGSPFGGFHFGGFGGGPAVHRPIRRPPPPPSAPVNPARTMRLTVGRTIYIIDFQLMTQSDSNDPSKRRRLQRTKKSDVLEEFQAGKGKGALGTKGQAGVTFVRTKSIGRR